MRLIASSSGPWTAGLRLAAAIGASALAAAPALAQPARPAVIVDWSALDALGPAPAQSAYAPVTLRAPPKPQQVAAVAATAPARSVVTPPTAPTPRPATEPPPQAAAPAPRPVVPAAAATSGAPSLARLNAVRFAQGRAELPPEGQDLLNSVAAQMAANTKLHLQLVAYASGEDAVTARRLSLSRAVQMRSYLIAKGVSTTRMDVRALGDRNEGGGPPDRVDVVFLDR